MKTTDTKLNLVQIEWEDHNTFGSGWHPRTYLERNSRPLRIVSVGAIVKETPEIISLIHTYSDSDNAIHGVTILKSDIIRRKKLYTK